MKLVWKTGFFLLLISMINPISAVQAQTSTASLWILENNTVTTDTLSNRWQSYNPHPPFINIDTHEFDPVKNVNIYTYGLDVWIFEAGQFRQTTISNYWAAYNPRPPAAGIDTLAIDANGTVYTTKGNNFWNLRPVGTSVTGLLSQAWASYPNHPPTDGGLDGVTYDSDTQEFVFMKNNAVWLQNAVTKQFRGPITSESYWLNYGNNIPPTTGIDTLAYIPVNRRTVVIKNPNYQHSLDLINYWKAYYTSGYQWLYQGKNYQYKENGTWGVNFQTLIRTESNVNECGRIFTPWRITKSNIFGYWSPKRPDPSWQGTMNLRFYLAPPDNLSAWRQTIYWAMGDKRYLFDQNNPLTGNFDTSAFLNGKVFNSLSPNYPAYFYTPKYIDALKGYYFFGDKSVYVNFLADQEANFCNLFSLNPAANQNSNQGWISYITKLPNISTPYYQGEVIKMTNYEFINPYMENFILREDWFVAPNIGIVRVDQKYFNESYIGRNRECSPEQRSAGKCDRICLKNSSANDPDCTKFVMDNPYLRLELSNFSADGVSPTPTQAPIFTTDQLKFLLGNYLSSNDSSYQPADGKVNMLDAGYVMRWIK